MGYRNFGSDPYYDSWRYENRRDHHHHPHRRPYDGYGRDGIYPCKECSPLPPIGPRPGPRPYPRGRAPYRDYPRYF